MSTSDRSSFIDKARIEIRAGAGGDGCMAFRREKFVDKGGPNGGNGGKGGDVYLRVNPHMRSLIDFSYRPHFIAQRGEHGQGWDCYGKAGEDLWVEVPPGTQVFENDKLLVDLVKAGDQILVAKGGRGGRGNAAFKTHRNTAPMLSERGEPGEEKVLFLELKLLADVGFVGLPNAGKSTLLARLTSARPKIADYPFTTLSPNLGVADWRGARFLVADIPGLIEGAHAGKGLGHDFLRHIERTRMLFHLVDVSGFDGIDPIKSIELIREELKAYSKTLYKKPKVLVLTKMDVSGADAWVTKIRKKYKKDKLFPISAVSGEGVDALLAYASKVVLMPEPEAPPVPAEPDRFVVELDFEVVRTDDGFRVLGKKVERFAAMTHFEQEEGLKRFQNILKKMGVEKALLRNGARVGDKVQIGPAEFEFSPTKRIYDKLHTHRYKNRK